MALRYASRKDQNQKTIVDGLRKVGIRVHVLNDRDIPDLLVGYRGRLYLFEIKDGEQIPSRRKLRPGQQKFMDEWAGYPIHKVESLAAAYAALGIEIRET